MSQFPYSTFFYDSPDLLAVMRGNGEIVELNNAWTEQLDLQNDSLKGESILKWIHEEDLERTLIILSQLKKGNSVSSFINRIRSGDGEFRSIHWSMQPEGEYILARGRDLNSDRTSGESELCSKEELTQIKKELEKAKQEKGQFLSNLSHEIRTPLNGVLGFAELLEKTELDSLQKQYVENTITSANTLLTIINDILTYSRIHSGKVKMEKDLTDIRGLIESTLNVIRDMAVEKELQLHLNIESNVPAKVEIDPVRVRQILNNLLNNAIKFTPRGEVELKVAFTPISKKYGRLHLSVRDTGVGISEEDKEKIFKAFSQVDNSNTRKFGGAGLGLIISNLLARRMGSEIRFESEQGKGSLFTLSLDTRYEGSVIRANCSEVRQAMIIDDNQTSRTILEHMLMDRDLECTSFQNGSSALGHLQNFDGYDLLFVNFDMAGISGLEIVKQIRKMEHQLKTIPTIVMMHNQDDSKVHEVCSSYSVDHYLHKPVFDNKLDRILKDADDRCRKQTSPAAFDTPKEGEASGMELGPAVILIAEDNKMNMMLNKILVAKLLPECRVLEAENGRVALDLLASEHVDLILMDIQMPEMDGLEATRAIRMEEKYTGKHIPIIAVTAGALQEEKEKCFEAGMDEFMTKPVDAQLLHSMLLKHLPKAETHPV